MDRTSQKPYKKTGFQQLGLGLKQHPEDFIEMVISTEMGLEPVKNRIQPTRIRSIYR